MLLLGARVGARVRGTRAESLVDQWLEEAAAFRSAPTGPTRALGWLAVARRRDTAGDVGGVLRACERGLQALDAHQATLGSLSCVPDRPVTVPPWPSSAPGQR